MKKTINVKHIPTWELQQLRAFVNRLSGSSMELFEILDAELVSRGVTHRKSNTLIRMGTGHYTDKLIIPYTCKFVDFTEDYN